MGSGVLLAALVVLWFVVLVPMVVTRGDSTARGAGSADSGRTLQRRRTADRLVSAETEQVTIDRAALRTTGELRVDVHAVRRRTLAGLVALTLLVLVGALTYRSWLWVPQVLLDLTVVGYLMVLRAAAQRERRSAARRAARMANRQPRPAAQRPRVQRPAPVSAPQVVQPAAVHHVAAQQQHPSLPLAPVHPLRPGRVVAARTPTPAGWQQSAVVGLDDEDIGFAEIDVYQPRRVANG